MNLREWLAAKGLQQLEFAHMIGANPSLVCRWVSGKGNPSPPWLRAIEKATKRKVGYDDFDWPAREGNSK